MNIVGLICLVSWGVALGQSAATGKLASPLPSIIVFGTSIVVAAWAVLA